MTSMDSDLFSELSRRERQIMDAVYRAGEATVAEIHGQIPEPPSVNALRRLVVILEEKGHLKRKWDGPRMVFLPTLARKKAARQALERVREIFFGGSAGQAAAALFEARDSLTEEDLALLSRLVDEAREEGR